MAMAMAMAMAAATTDISPVEINPHLVIIPQKKLNGTVT